MTTCQHCKREITPPTLPCSMFDTGADGSAWTWGRGRPGDDSPGLVEGFAASCASCLGRAKARLRAAIDDADRNEWEND